MPTQLKFCSLIFSFDFYLKHISNNDWDDQVEGRLKGWELDPCGDCWVSDGCLVDKNDTPTAIDAHMYRAKVRDEEKGEHGGVHMRQSIHNPNIAVNMQSTVNGGCLSMARDFRDGFLKASGVDRFPDITQIEKFAENGNAA